MNSFFKDHSKHAEDECIQHLFEAQVKRSGDAVAVVFQDQQISYEELNRRANKLAHHLRKVGVRPEVPVGVCMERNIDIVVGILGVLKAGGIYVPMDPSYPQERLWFVINDTLLPVLLTHEHLQERLPNHWALTVNMDTEWEAIAECSQENVDSDVTGLALAYVIYTSGSTGAPKGVMIEHRGLINTVKAAIKGWGIEREDRVIQLYSFSFDASIMDLFMTLGSGATLYLSSQNVRFAGPELVQLIQDEGITVAKLPPAVLAVLPTETLTSLRTIVSGGEALQINVANRWAKNLNLFCVYGPTEATVATSWYKVEQLPEVAKSVPIGRPLANTQLYILDSDSQPVPIGVAGQLHIGGIKLARGYLNNADLTAESFTPDPFGQEPGARLYKSGDLVRYLPDRNAEFLGRIDNQVKIRGFRIELGEVEAVLSQHPAVRETIVLAREDTPGNKRLVAYALINERQTVKTSELQSFVKKKLPDYMIPSAFVFLERFPLNINGKVDRQALPPPLTNSDELEREYVAPRTELERFLADNWQHRLGVKQVGVHDNFFEMGGDSIRAALFINDLQQKGGEFVHIVTLFDNPTIADLAIFLSEQFPNAVARMCGLRPAGEKAKAGVRHAARVDEEAVAHIRELIPILPPFRESQKELKNPQAIFILCPPRSGSTLLRVMLAGHSELFAPPELQLLCFNTLTDRKEAFAGRFNFWLEGTIRALMEIKGCDDEKARALMEAYEQEGMSAKEFYRLMQEWIGRRRLVDKTPGYALDIEVLRRAERYFENPLYIHLIRSPYGMINSFEKAKLDQIFKYGHEYSVRELGELMWLVCHQNILEFLREVPEQRQFKIRFETLVAQPRDVMEKLCRFAGLEFYPDMLQPQQNGKRKMTDGIHGLSRMLGDINFHEHKSIDSQVANRWKESVTEDFLGEVTLKVAQSLGYERIGESATKDDGYELSAKEAMTIRQIRRDGKTQLPVSLGQQRVWSLTRMAPNNPFYNVTFSKRLIGRLNVQAFEQSIQELVRRHESLRTGFPIINGEPMQVITPSVTVKPMIADLSKLPKDEREACARNLLSQDEQLRFDLNQASLLRVYLLRLDKEEHILLLTMHHLVCDPWSIGLLIKELIALYKVFLAGQLSTLPVPLIQYADYAMWQREWLRGEELEKQASYWKKQLAGAPALLNLPTDRARQAIPTYEGARMMIETPGEVYDRLNELSRQEGATLFMTVLAAFQLLLCRYTGQEDVYIGSHITNRYRPEIEATVGFFANTLIFRTDLSGKPTFRELLRRARKVTLEAYAHQDLPFEQLIEILQPERGFGYVPSVQVVFNMMNVGFDPQRVPGLRVDELTVHRVTAKFDLCLVLFPDLSGFLDYSAELFDNSTIERMIRDFQTILASVAANPDAKI